MKYRLFNYIQCDQLNMAVFFGTFKNYLSSVRYCTRVHCTSHFLQGTRKTRPCLIGHPVSVKGS